MYSTCGAISARAVNSAGKEGGKIFGSGSRTPIAVTFLVKNPATTAGKATIYYYDIGDYLNREEKLAIVKKFGSIESLEDQWQVLQTNEHGDWLNQRDEAFGNWIPMEPEKKFDSTTKTFFTINGPGIASNRDAWVYNFSKGELESNMKRMIEFYNDQTNGYKQAKQNNQNLIVDDFIENDPSKISWSRALKNDVAKLTTHAFSSIELTQGTYRGFCKQNFYYDRNFVESPGLNKQFFPNQGISNEIICVAGVGSNKDFSVLISNRPVDYQVQFNTQCFPLYYYEDRPKAAPSLFDAAGEPERVRRDGVSDFILGQARARYGDRVTKEDIFYYVYGFLHSPEYRERFSSDLKKMLPRLPLVESPKDFWAFSKAGRLLADLHLHYDDFSKSLPAEGGGVRVLGAESGQFRVEKMRFPSKTDKSRILYNSHISVENIPAEAYEYVVNGKSAIEWVMERYAITTHKDSGIRNDPNDWAAECGNPRYILDVLLSVIRLSVETVEVVRGLPGLNL
jgi:predicted helicase